MKSDSQKEEEFAMAEVFSRLEKTCPIHNVGEKDFEKLRYRCPTCNKLLKKQKRK